MNFQFYLEKLFGSKEFENFNKDNPGAYPCSCFFGRDFENLKNPDNKQHIDYFVPSVKKIFSFKLEEGVNLVPVELIGDADPSKISLNYNFDFDDVEDLIMKKMQEEGVSEKVQKILLSMQNNEGKDYLVGTAFLSKMGLLKLAIDVSEMKITEFEKKSFLDIMNIFKK